MKMLWGIVKWAGIEKAAERRTLHSFGRYLIIRIYQLISILSSVSSFLELIMSSVDDCKD
jgi:hypothetical protein